MSRHSLEHLITILLIFYILFLVLPLTYTFTCLVDPFRSVWLALSTPAAVKFPDLHRLIEFYPYGDSLLIVVRGVDFGVILNSVLLGLTVSLTSTFTALICSSICYVYRVPGKLLYIPLLSLIPIPFVEAIAFEKLFNPSFGLINYFVSCIPLLSNFRFTIRGLAGVFLYQFAVLYPIALVIVSGYISSMPGELIEASYSLGGRPSTTILRIIIPYSKPAIIASLITTFTFSIDDVVGPIIFQGDSSARNLLSYRVYAYFIEEITGRIVPQSAGYALILLLISIAVFVFGYRYIPIIYRSFGSLLVFSAKHYRERISIGSALLFLMVSIVNFAITAPMIISVIYAFSEKWIASPFPILGSSPFNLLFQSSTRLRAVLNSLLYTLASIVISAFISFIAGYYTSRFKSVFSVLIDLLISIPLALPGIVVAYSYFHTFTRLNLFPSPIRSPWIYLILAYAVRRTPYLYRVVQTMVTSIPLDLEEAAEFLGANFPLKMRDVVLPLMAKPLKISILITCIQIATEVSTSITIGGLGGAQGFNHQAPITYVVYTDISLSGLVYANIASSTVLFTLLLIAIAVLAPSIIIRMVRRV